MSTFEDNHYRWRETFFVLFDSAGRPAARAVQQLLKKVNASFEITELREDEDGAFESVRVIAPNSCAALDVSYLCGEEVLEQGAELSEQMQDASMETDFNKVARLPACDARFDILHFEEVLDEDDDDVFDPSAMLLVVQALTRLTDGVAVDPQTGVLM